MKLSFQKKTTEEQEFGDFQTPDDLALQVVSTLKRIGINPVSVLEPTCGKGNLLFAAIEGMSTINVGIGVEISPLYAEWSRERTKKIETQVALEIIRDDFFLHSWPDTLGKMVAPFLIVGNPPWVTNSQIGSLGGNNLPTKSNFHGLNGFDAITGKSNFDISEWMIIQCLHWIHNKNATLAMLCKTSVARKVYFYAKESKISLCSISIHRIDAQKSFGAAVDACLLVCTSAPGSTVGDCPVFADLYSDVPVQKIGVRQNTLISRVDYFDKWKHLLGTSSLKWRSGVKHDCSKVMELRCTIEGLENGLGETVQIESEFLYPMLKTSDVANGKLVPESRRMLVTQKSVGESTSEIYSSAPKTWEYLLRHSHLLDRRTSAIYKSKPRFSVFGVGPYAFAPYKVAISGFYKSLEFRLIEPYEGKPVMLDDATYFLPAKSIEEAKSLLFLLQSLPATELLQSLIFWDNKRPVTAEILRKLDLNSLAIEVGDEPLQNVFQF